jgi:protease PrsW
MNLALLLLIAILPGIAITVFIYIADKHEPEPIKLLMLSFLYGIVAFGLNLLIAFPLESYFDFNKQELMSQAIHAFVIVSFIEESCKFIFIRGILYKNENFNEPLDGIVYAVMVGMGFATAENILYVINGDGGTALLRMFAATPAHALFAVLMGYMLGKAKFAKKREFLYSFYALTVATLFHGVYDYFLFISFVPGIWILSAIALILAFMLSRKAVILHQRSSPFIEKEKTKK